MTDLKIILILFFGISFNKLYSQQWGSNASTTPFGATNISITEAAEDNIPSFTFLSIGYEDSEYAYSGTIESIDGVKITLHELDGGEFSENPYEENELTQYPHFIRLRDGDKYQHNGKIYPVIGNSGNVITINITPSNASDVFTATDSIDIIRANTLGSLFGTGDEFHGKKGTPSFADNIIVWNSIGWKTYFYNGDCWQTFGTRSSQDNSIIYPDEGIIYVRKDTEPLTLSFSGVTPTIIQTYMPGAGEKFLMANPFPTEMKLSQLIDTSSNWEKSQNIDECDIVLYWSGNAWKSYYYDINNWRSVTSGEVDDRVIESGECIFIVKNKISSDAFYRQINLP